MERYTCQVHQVINFHRSLQRSTSYTVELCHEIWFPAQKTPVVYKYTYRFFARLYCGASRQTHIATGLLGAQGT